MNLNYIVKSPEYRVSVFLMLLFLVAYPAASQENDTVEKKISLLFIGDIMGHDTQIASAFDKVSGTYNYDSVFKYIKPVLSEADVAIANLEVTLAGPPYKGYPQFSSPAAIAAACINAGIDAFVLANNHVADRGKQGILSTLHKLDSMCIPRTGSYRDNAERDSLSPLMIRKNGFTLALLNYTYGTNGLIVPKPLIVDSLNKDLIAKDIQKAKNMKPDAVILFLHWGTEYDTVPSAAQNELADFCLKNGADLVIGSHPHVLQKMIRTGDNSKKQGAVAYSLGNFVSNQRKPKTDGGAIVRIELEKIADSLFISDAGYYLTWVYTPVERERLRFYILPCTGFEDRSDFFHKIEDYSMMQRFIRESRELLNGQNIGFREYIFRAETPSLGKQENIP